MTADLEAFVGIVGSPGRPGVECLFGVVRCSCYSMQCSAEELYGKRALYAKARKIYDTDLD